MMRMLLANDAQNVAAGIWIAVVIAVAVAAVAVFVAGLISVLGSRRLTTTGRVVWVIAMFVFPLLGPIAWFVFGRRSAAAIYR